MKRIQIAIVALSLALLSSVPLSGQHFVPVYQSLYQPMNIIINGAMIGGVDLEAGDEIGIFDTDISGIEICVGSIVLSGPITTGNPLPMVASTDDILTPEQDGFIVGNEIIYRFWDNSASSELICVDATYDPGFDDVFVSLGTALCGLEGTYGATANAGLDDLTCGDSPYTLSGSATNQDSVLWETSGDGIFDDATLLTATYSPGTIDESNGSVTLTLTAYAIVTCGTDATDDMELSIQATPIADAGLDDFVCGNESYMLSGTATNQDSVLWTSAGDGSFDDATLLDATYTPGTGDISNGSVILTLTSYAILPCANHAMDDMVLGFNALPTANAGGDEIICENDTYTLSGSATDYSSVLWTTLGDGSFDDASLLDATYTPGFLDRANGSVILTLTAYALAPCIDIASDDMLLSFADLPFAYAGPDAAVCQGEDYTVSGMAENHSKTLWKTSGDGSFHNPNLLNTLYTPGPEDIIYGFVTLRLTAFAQSPCTTPMTDALFLSIDQLPGTPATPTGPIEVDLHFTTTSGYEVIPPTPAATEYTWTLSPAEAGNIAGSTVAATVTWNATYHGFAYVKVYAENACASMVSDSLEVFVYTSVGLGENSGDQVNVMVIPNPNNGSFKVNIDRVQSEINLDLYGSNGILVESHTLNERGTVNMDFNMEGLPKGMYFIRIYNDKQNIISKVIVQ